MATIQLADEEWQQVMAIIANAPWRDANPLLMKIGAQLQAQSPSGSGIRLDTNSKEARQ